MSEPFDILLEKYARLVIRVGVNVQPGQEVVINGLPEQAAVARALADEAYRVGASRVTIEYIDPHVQRASVVHGPEEALGKTPAHKLEGIRAWRESRPAVIGLSGNPFPNLMDGLDPERLLPPLSAVLLPTRGGRTVPLGKQFNVRPGAPHGTFYRFVGKALVPIKTI